MMGSKGCMDFLDEDGSGDIIELTEVVSLPGERIREKIQIPQEMLEKAVENVIENIFHKKIGAVLADALEKAVLRERESLRKAGLEKSDRA